MTKGFASLRVAVALAALVLCGASTSVAQVSDAAKKTGNAITDSWITMKVHSQFIPDDVLEGSDIDVDTSAGVVVLKGTVPTAAAKTRAVAIAKATDGVKSVTDQLRIGKPEGVGEAAREATGTTGKAVTDGWIKSKIYTQYLTEDALDDSDLDIDVTKGSVVLNGTVKSDAGRTRAEAIAKATDGVKSVKNNLKVSPK
jgi:hyperosmotically inducible periplasmic protein